MYKYFLIVLTLSLMIVSCSKDQRPHSNSDSPNSAEGEAEGEAQGEAEGEAEGQAQGQAQGQATEGQATEGQAQETGGEPPSHWISAVPFQRIKAGTFTMGSPEDEPGRENDENQVQVSILKPFEIMKYEVTQNQWVKVMGSNPSYFKESEDCDNHTAGMCPNNPVENISWDEVQEFIKKLNDSLGLTSCNDGGITGDSSPGCYRLPTEAEWEYAVRAGTSTAYFFGDEPSGVLENYAWYNVTSDSKNKTHPVGMKKPNPWGLYDVYGNVWEFMQDNPYVCRGGSWWNGIRNLRTGVFVFRSANRSRDNSPGSRGSNVGFRLVRAL